MEALHDMLARGRKAGIETRGISDHGFIQSIYFRDPNGYVIELTARSGEGETEDPNEAKRAAHRALAQWQASKPQ